MHIYRKYHISMQFLKKDHFSFSAYRKKIYFREKRYTIFPDITKKIIFQRDFLGKTLFRTFEENIIFPCIFFEKDHLFFFHLKNKIIFSGKRSIIFPDNTTWIIFQCNFIGKTIFSEHLEKKNLVFFAVLSSPDSTILSCFFFFFFIIVLYLLIQ